MTCHIRESTGVPETINDDFVLIQASVNCDNAIRSQDTQSQDPETEFSHHHSFLLFTPAAWRSIRCIMLIYFPLIHFSFTIISSCNFQWDIHNYGKFKSICKLIHEKCNKHHSSFLFLTEVLHFILSNICSCQCRCQQEKKQVKFVVYPPLYFVYLCLKFSDHYKLHNSTALHMELN